MFEEDQLNVPLDCKLSEDDEHSLPYFLVGDEIFPLKEWLMRPYPGGNASEEEQICNYQHSRAQQSIENAFVSSLLIGKYFTCQSGQLWKILKITLLHAWPSITIHNLQTTPITPLQVLLTLRTKIEIFFPENGDCKKKMVQTTMLWLIYHTFKVLDNVMMLLKQEMD